MSFLQSYTAVAIVVSLVWVWVRRYYARSYPPGPQPLPLIGNLRDLPTEQEWLRYTEWYKQYGSIVHVKLFSRSVIVLNTVQVATDLLDKTATTFADRPNSIVMDLLGWTRGVALQPYGDRHREYRRMLNSRLNPTAIKELWEPQSFSARSLARALAEHPEDFRAQVRKVVGESIVALAFGESVSDENFDYIARQDKSHVHFSRAATPYAFPLDFVPFLQYMPEFVPGASFKKTLREWRADLDELVYRPYRLVKARFDKGSARPSYMAKCIESAETLTPETEESIMWTTASLYTGGTDTTIAAILTFILAMTLFPEAQTKAQEELDRVIGNDRLPTHDDRASLPYIDACVKEVFRWHPVQPLGAPRNSREDTVYNNYYIPKDTIVFVNMWAMFHDPNTYKDPDVFRPERFLGPTPEKDIGSIPYGFGRRICPGMHLADAHLFIYYAHILAILRISKARNAAGGEIEPLDSYSKGVISVPEPFECSIKPRSAETAALVMN